MNTNDALTTTATQVETILTHHSVTYTTTDNRGKEEDDYRITVGDVTAYLTASATGGPPPTRTRPTPTTGQPTSMRSRST